MVHELKTWPAFFQAIERGLKKFEVRKNDRGYQAGDVLELKEWCPDIAARHGSEKRGYTGNEMVASVTYVLSGTQHGIVDGYVVMAITPLLGEAPE